MLQCIRGVPAARQVLNSLAHMNDGAASVPRRKLAQLLYGRDSVFARQPTPAQVCGCPGPYLHCQTLIS